MSISKYDYKGLWGNFTGALRDNRLEDDLKQSSLLQFEGSRLEAQVGYIRASLSAVTSLVF